jgi:purine-binding chemotaxis protein CheW
VTEAEAHLTSRTAELRRAFDRTFAEPPRSIAEDTESLLDIRVGADAYAVRVSELSGLFVDRMIVPMPSPVPELLGLAGLPVGIVPVYTLHGLLGHPPVSDPPRWLIVTGHGQPVGLAFDRLDRYLRLRPSDLSPSSTGTRAVHIHEAARVTDGVRPVLSIASVLKAIKDRTGVPGTKER